MSTTIERTRSIRATAPLAAWRTVDILTIAFLGAAFGIAYWGWGLAYQAPSTARASSADSSCAARVRPCSARSSRLWSR